MSVFGNSLIENAFFAVEKRNPELLNLALDNLEEHAKRATSFKETAKKLGYQNESTLPKEETINVLVLIVSKESKMEAGKSKTKERTLLMAAAESGWAEGVKMLLAAGADTAIINNEGRMALHFATFCNHTDAAMLLCDKLPKSASETKLDAIKQSDLKEANKTKETTETKTSLVDLKDARQMTCIHYAAKNRNPQVTAALIAKTANANAKVKDFRMGITRATTTSLHLALYSELAPKEDKNNSHSQEQTATVNALLTASNPQVDAFDQISENSNDKTPLHLASEICNPTVVQALLDKGADSCLPAGLNTMTTGVRNKTAVYPITFAVKNKGDEKEQAETVKILLQNMRNKNITSDNQYRALCNTFFHGPSQTLQEVFEIAVIHCRPLAIRQLIDLKNDHLKKMAEDYQAKEQSFNETLLHEVLLAKNVNENSRHETVKILLDNFSLKLDAKTSRPSHSGFSALMLACFFKQNVAVALLLAKKVNVHIKNLNGQNALMIAAMNGNTEAVKLLLSTQVDINAKDNLGNTALYYAVMYAHETTVAALLGHPKIRIDLLNDAGKTVFHICKNLKITKTLLEFCLNQRKLQLLNATSKDGTPVGFYKTEEDFINGEIKKSSNSHKKIETGLTSNTSDNIFKQWTIYVLTSSHGSTQTNRRNTYFKYMMEKFHLYCREFPNGKDTYLIKVICGLQIGLKLFESDSTTIRKNYLDKILVLKLDEIILKFKEFTDALKKQDQVLAAQLTKIGVQFAPPPPPAQEEKMLPEVKSTPINALTAPPPVRESEASPEQLKGIITFYTQTLTPAQEENVIAYYAPVTSASTAILQQQSELPKVTAKRSPPPARSMRATVVQNGANDSASPDVAPVMVTVSDAPVNPENTIVPEAPELR